MIQLNLKCLRGPQGKEQEGRRGVGRFAVHHHFRSGREKVEVGQLPSCSRRPEPSYYQSEIIAETQGVMYACFREQKEVVRSCQGCVMRRLNVERHLKSSTRPLKTEPLAFDRLSVSSLSSHTHIHSQHAHIQRGTRYNVPHHVFKLIYCPRRRPGPSFRCNRL